MYFQSFLIFFPILVAVSPFLTESAEAEPESEIAMVNARLWSIFLILSIVVTSFPLIAFCLENADKPSEPSLKKGLLLGTHLDTLSIK